MKFLILLTLVTVVLGDYDKKMINQWQSMKAIESCWGEENMKKLTVNMKRAIATCSNQDAPELFLPPYRSSYRFVNTIINGANKMESEQYDLMEKMMWFLQEQGQKYGSNGRRHNMRPYSSDYQTDSSSNKWMEKMQMRFRMKQMMEEMMEESAPARPYRQNDNDNFDNKEMMEFFRSMFANKMDNSRDSYTSNSYTRDKQQTYKKDDTIARMSQLMDMFARSRSKRAVGQKRDGLANPNLDLGDRLVEKLNEQKKEMEAKIGNLTCVLKEMKYLNSDNQLDVRAIKKDMEQYTMPSPWFAQRYEELIDTCYEMATNLPAPIEENSVITGESFGTVKLAEVKSFMKCCSKAKTRLCMNQDIKKKIESNFGPLEDILEQTQLTEYQIFPLVIQLLHGQEMEYMGGEY